MKLVMFNSRCFDRLSKFGASREKISLGANLVQANRFKRMLVLSILVLSLGACSSITVRPNGGIKDVSMPHYLDSKKYYLWGSIGEHDIYVSKICGDKKVKQMQSIMTVSDWVRTSLTLGIIYFKTAKVWCEKS